MNAGSAPCGQIRFTVTLATGFTAHWLPLLPPANRASGGSTQAGLTLPHVQRPRSSVTNHCLEAPQIVRALWTKVDGGRVEREDNPGASVSESTGLESSHSIQPALWAWPPSPILPGQVPTPMLWLSTLNSIIVILSLVLPVLVLLISPLCQALG